MQLIIMQSVLLIKRFNNYHLQVYEGFSQLTNGLCLSNNMGNKDLPDTFALD